MSNTTTCTECGAEASGNFCASCGAALGKRFCTQCGAPAAPGAKFCTGCGAALGGGSPGGSGETRATSRGPSNAGAAGGGGGEANNMAWWIAGAMMVVIIIFMARPILFPADPGTPNAPFATGGGTAGGVTDISNMTPREAADRLYNRVMSAAEVNDSAQVNTFLPMAIQSYEMARPLDLDGLFHLSRLQRMGVLDADALATAEEALTRDPNYLLGLYAAGDAALGMGDAARAQEYLGRLLQVWDAEMASGNPDYELHSRQMDGIRDFAREAVSGG